MTLSENRQNSGPKMAVDSQNDSGVLGAKRGVPIYETNPSIPVKGGVPRTRKRQLGDDHRGLVINDGSGEILGRGTAVAYEWEEVDAERFVKLFMAGLKQATGLSKAGLSIFEVVYLQLRERPNNDKVEMSFFRARKHNPTLVDRTYQRWLRELLDRQFLYRSPSEGVFFVNIQYMFNGDRLAFVKAYHLKGAKPQHEQLSLLPPEE
jgi:hypothetical protein